MFTLFSVMNGDQISDVYAQVTFSQFMIGNIYMYSFVFISICVVQNVFITIITDGYMSIKYRSNYDWLEKRMTPILP
jgi:hypothetical protein